MSFASLRFHPVPAAFVAGFAVVIAVNGLMIWLAISSFSGLYSDHARDHGVHYNEIVADQRARDALGWRVDVRWLPDTRSLQVSVADAKGAPLAGGRVMVELVRPAERRASIDVDLLDLGGGQYAATVDLPVLGNWDADLAIDAAGRRFVITKRLFLR